jgi:hypothetical protein
MFASPPNDGRLFQLSLFIVNINELKMSSKVTNSSVKLMLRTLQYDLWNQLGFEKSFLLFSVPLTTKADDQTMDHRIPKEEG